LSVDYRLAPEHTFETQIEDCRSVLEWVAKNKTQFSSDSAKIGVSGDSAGGHYSAILTHEYRNLIDYQVLIYPCVDLINTYASNLEFSSECFWLTKDMIDFFIKNFILNLDDLATPKVSPLLNEDFTRLPKSLIIAAELDPLVDQIKAYHEKLKSSSNQSDLKIIKGTIHGFFHNGFFLKEALNETLQHISDFFKQI
jgi:acetyl esterase